ncbi:hypothetical protein NQ318_013403 [Aromia moschata]|uniref:Uncharacterized protein n=1 Tax=Aromia moschata TaxID=1265417 RepID=A0AAV8XYX7_9CUCU|nr:hypothetical protein NQ318_013403 [Aromia moschata]
MDSRRALTSVDVERAFSFDNHMYRIIAHNINDKSDSLRRLPSSSPVIKYAERITATVSSENRQRRRRGGAWPSSRLSRTLYTVETLTGIYSLAGWVAYN